MTSSSHPTVSASGENLQLLSERKPMKFLKVDGWRSEYASVDLLLKHLSRRSKSEGSRKVYLFHLFSFCVHANMNPDKLAELSKTRIENLVQRYSDKLSDSNHSIRYINGIQHTLKTFFKSNGFKGNKALEVESRYMSARYRKMPEYIPTKNEVYAIADCACSLRDRAIILTLYSSGLRNSTLRALLYKDVKEEISKDFSNLLLPIYPEMKFIDPYACKNKIPYYTFTCDEATEATRLYLNERTDKYGKIDDLDPLFTSEYNQIRWTERKRKILTACELQIIIKNSAKRAGISQWRYVCPRCLRKSCETVLHSDLIDGGHLDVKVQEFFMGHILPRSEDPYLDKTKIEEMRCLYSKLKFGRVRVENKFKILIAALNRAFEGTSLDPEQVMKEYLMMKQLSQ